MEAHSQSMRAAQTSNERQSTKSFQGAASCLLDLRALKERLPALEVTSFLGTPFAVGWVADAKVPMPSPHPFQKKHRKDGHPPEFFLLASRLACSMEQRGAERLQLHLPYYSAHSGCEPKHQRTISAQ